MPCPGTTNARALAKAGLALGTLAIALGSLLPGCKRHSHVAPAPSGSAAASAAPSASAPHSIQSAIPAANEVAETDAGTPSQGPVHSIGEKVDARDYRMTLETVKECKSKQYYHPREGSMWLGVQVKLESTSDKELRVNPFYARLEDSQHHTYTPTFGGCHPVLDSMRMKKGDKTHGWITFEVPRSATGIHLVYDPFIVGAPHEPLEFMVVR